MEYIKSWFASCPLVKDIEDGITKYKIAIVDADGTLLDKHRKSIPLAPFVINNMIRTMKLCIMNDYIDITPDEFRAIMRENGFNTEGNKVIFISPSRLLLKYMFNLQQTTQTYYIGYIGYDNVFNYVMAKINNKNIKFINMGDAKAMEAAGDVKFNYIVIGREEFDIDMTKYGNASYLLFDRTNIEKVIHKLGRNAKIEVIGKLYAGKYINEVKDKLQFPDIENSSIIYIGDDIVRDYEFCESSGCHFCLLYSGITLAYDIYKYSHITNYIKYILPDISYINKFEKLN